MKKLRKILPILFFVVIVMAMSIVVYAEGDTDLTEDVDVVSKTGKPVLEKNVKDVNDTTGTTTDWQDSADYDIGDVVSFKITGTVADNYDQYENYYYAFHDVEETGLSFNANSIKVSVDNTVDDRVVNTEINASDYTVRTTEEDGSVLADGCTFEVVFSDLKTITDENNNLLINKDSKIIIEFTSTLNSDAVLGNQGNVSKTALEFSNNANSRDETETTSWENVIVFTYKVVIYPVGSDDQLLKGAKFTLTKDVAKKDKDGNNVKDKNGKDVYTATTVKVVENTESTEFVFNGLDDGTYILTETKTPKGYSAIKPITFTVTAKHTTAWDGEDRADVLASLTGTVSDKEITLTAADDKSTLTANVMNGMENGSSLMTIAIFCVSGAVVIFAVILIVVLQRKKR